MSWAIVKLDLFSRSERADDFGRAWTLSSCANTLFSFGRNRFRAGDLGRERTLLLCSRMEPLSFTAATLVRPRGGELGVTGPASDSKPGVLFVAMLIWATRCFCVCTPNRVMGFRFDLDVHERSITWRECSPERGRHTQQGQNALRALCKTRPRRLTGRSPARQALNSGVFL